MALDEPKATDTSFDQGDISYIIDKELMDRTGEILIDYVDAGYQSGFSIRSANPVVGAGGCSPAGGCSC